MEKNRADQIKSQLRQELREELQDTIEEEIQEELEEAQAVLKKKTASQFIFSISKGSFFAVVAVIMALGQYSEAVVLISDSVATVRSIFTNDIEYELISKIHVGNTESYMESLLGSPQVSKSIDNEITANYFFNKKYLLTLFIKESRVTAFTILPLKADFQPETIQTVEGAKALGEANFIAYPGNPQLYVLNHAKTASYYLESLDKGRTGLFVQSYLGLMSYSVDAESINLAALYKAEVHGTEQEILKLQTQFRESEFPNFYGEGELNLELIEKSILTGAELSSYFGQL
ncbi:MAG: hypothetical protein KUG82_06270 [Pseudomonadales bacterium]|nr:hypothetical protein [Pseudomonadales bacterium]